MNDDQPIRDFRNGKVIPYTSEELANALTVEMCKMRREAESDVSRYNREDTSFDDRKKEIAERKKYALNVIDQIDEVFANATGEAKIIIKQLATVTEGTDT